MKIAIVCPYDWSVPGGVRSHIDALAASLRTQGNIVHIITAATQPIEVPDVHVVGAVIRLRMNGSIARLGFANRKHLSDLMRAERYDIIHLHEPLLSPLPFQLALLARKLRIPAVGTFHTDAAPNEVRWYRRGRPLVRPAFLALRERIAVTEVAELTIKQVFPGVYHRIPNGVDSRYFTIVRSPQPHAVPTVLFLGRLEPRKGVKTLLDAIPHTQALARAAGDAVPRFIIAGDGPLRALCAQAAQDNPLIDLPGVVSDAEKERLLAMADVFCAPSLGSESQGIVLLEALAARVPIVASAIPGYRTVITSDEIGALTPPGDSRALAESLHRLLHDAALRQCLAEQGYAAARPYDWQRLTTQIIAVYEQALAT